MIAANQEVFRRLDNFCASKEVEVINAGAPRWINSSNKHKGFLKKAEVKLCFHVSQSKKIVRIDLFERSYYIVVGLDGSSDNLGVNEIDLEASHLTILLCEVRIRPSASAYIVKNLVELDDKVRSSNYNGHEAETIASLFPKIRVLELPIVNEQSTWRLFFRLCLEECKENDSWINQELADTLLSICDLDPARIPYRVLCKSIFDGDPANFFLSLYRCLEALYAYSSAKDLASTLSLTVSWPRIAAALEDKLGWHPKEEGSLDRLLRFASPLDLDTLISSIDHQEPPAEIERKVANATRRVYWLRNSIVHFRPLQHGARLEDYDWIAICKALSGAVFDVYYAVGE